MKIRAESLRIFPYNTTVDFMNSDNVVPPGRGIACVTRCKVIPLRATQSYAPTANRVEVGAVLAMSQQQLGTLFGYLPMLLTYLGQGYHQDSGPKLLLDRQ